MICAAYFTGPAAPDLARQMVLADPQPLSSLPAYVFNYADEERKKQQDVHRQAGQPFAVRRPAGWSASSCRSRTTHARVHVEEQCAVMIGGYPDDEAAHTRCSPSRTWRRPS